MSAVLVMFLLFTLTFDLLRVAVFYSLFSLVFLFFVVDQLGVMFFPYPPPT